MDRQIADVFRNEWTRLVAILVRDFGDLGLAEDVAQEAFVEASRRWDADGTPDRPGAWLLTTARRRAIDRVRRAKRLDALIPILATDAPDRAGATSADAVDDHAALDEQLALLVGCCHPALAPEAQIALTLRVVGGLSTAQIARAFLVSESSMTRRLTRSKDKIRAARIPFDAPTLETLHERLPAVCGVIYSIFTEGHASARSTELVRGDLCDEAIWLAELLVALVPGDPEVDGLLALLLLIDARRCTRADDRGDPVLLADQDRTTWDRAKIASGLDALSRAHAVGHGGMYQFQAAIAAVHATAATFADTDWAAIVGLYDVMLVRQPAKIIALNRAIAVAQINGPGEALRELDTLAVDDGLYGDLGEYPYFHSTRAEMLVRIDRHDDAVAAFERALESSENEAEQRHLRRRRDEVADVERTPRRRPVTSSQSSSPP